MLSPEAILVSRNHAFIEKQNSPPREQPAPRVWHRARCTAVQENTGGRQHGGSGDKYLSPAGGGALVEGGEGVGREGLELRELGDLRVELHQGIRGKLLAVARQRGAHTHEARLSAPAPPTSHRRRRGNIFAGDIFLLPLHPDARPEANPPLPPPGTPDRSKSSRTTGRQAGRHRLPCSPAIP